jgi:hypothetical protein
VENNSDGDLFTVKAYAIKVGKLLNFQDLICATMDNERLSRLHKILGEPWRRRILLELSQHDGLSLDALAFILKVKDVDELRRQLTGLEQVTFEGEFLISNLNGYRLTEQGHFVLDEMLAFPELKSEEYKQKWGDQKDKPPPKPLPKWWKPYWIALFVSAIIVMGIVNPIVFREPFNVNLLWLFFGLALLGMAYYVRAHPPSLETNRLAYIFLVGTFIGSLLFLASMAIPTYGPLDRPIILGFCLVFGWIVGDLIGRAFDYEGPKQYSP